MTRSRSQFLRFALLHPRSALLRLRWNKRRRRHLRIQREIAGHFDPAYYRAAYPDVARLKLAPIRHYIVAGAREGRNPSPAFSTAAYVKLYPDVRRLGFNPLHHFLEHGTREAREAVPAADGPMRLTLAGIGRRGETSAAAGDARELTLDDVARPHSLWLDVQWNIAWERNYRTLRAIRDAFDPEFYLESYPEVAALGIDPIQHYIVAGWKEGKDPSPTFSTNAYLEANTDVRRLRTNPFEHYLKSGREEGRRSLAVEEQIAERLANPHLSPLDTISLLRRPRSLLLHLRWHLKEKKYRHIRNEIREDFDNRFYLDTYPEVAKLKIGPVRHYILTGWKEGKDPSPLFSTSAYIKMYGDVREQNINPFHHFVVHGRKEGRAASVSFAGHRALNRPNSLLHIPLPPTAEEWAAMPRRVLEPATAPGVNVVIPVYKSLEHTAATIHSVLVATNDTPFECLVIDDCSPEPEVSALLADLAASGHIRLLVNATNQGFVRTVNRGMAHNAERDVVLLNSDTWVSDGWLDRIMALMRDHPDVASITPISNNATIASYPNNAVDNAFELEADAATLDRLAAEVNTGTIVDVPTGIGFCMAIRRKALDAIGPFDAQTFGLGYGEECDFSMRAAKAGWRNVVAPGIYVRHYGSASFGPSQAARSAEAQQRLAEKHPEYAGMVGRHIAADPVLPSRILLDVARLRQAMGEVSILFVSHTRGGGIDTYLRNIRIAMVANGLEDVVDRAVVLQHGAEGFVRLKTFSGDRTPYMPNIQGLNYRRHAALLSKLVGVLDPEFIHVNSFAGLPIETIDRLMTTIETAGKPYWHVWHDHQPLCPRLTFLDAEERYCGETDVTRCHSCLTSTPSDIEWVPIEDWRERFRRYLAGAEVVSAPSEAAAVRARRIVGVNKVKVHPHPEPTQVTSVAAARRLVRDETNGRGDNASTGRRAARLKLDGKRHVLILGAIGPHKGSFLLHGMLRDIANRKLPLHIDILGYTNIAEIKTSENCTLYGRYAGDADAVKRIQQIRPDLTFFSSVWPETYVFTLTVAMAMQLPTVAFDIGAQGERLASYGRGRLLGTGLMANPIAVNDALIALDLDALWSAPVEAPVSNPCAVSDYLLSHRPALPVPAAAAPAALPQARGAGSARRSAGRISLTP